MPENSCEVTRVSLYFCGFILRTLSLKICPCGGECRNENVSDLVCGESEKFGCLPPGKEVKANCPRGRNQLLAPFRQPLVFTDDKPPATEDRRMQKALLYSDLEGSARDSAPARLDQSPGQPRIDDQRLHGNTHHGFWDGSGHVDT